MSIAVPVVRHRQVEVDGVQVFYRETEPTVPDAPTMLLLHGFPASSHQFRRLLDMMGSAYRLVAPDYPGFGHTRAPDGFEHTFERLTDVVDRFVESIGLAEFIVYMFDFGAPVGFRLVQRRSESIVGLVLQNANAYDEGLSPSAREFIALHPEGAGHEQHVRDLLTLDGTRSQYVQGTTDLTLLPPDGWVVDQFHLDEPGRKEAQVALAFDYKQNLERYPEWQEWLATHRPPALVLWGREDPFFLPAGATAYVRQLPEAKVHLLDAGHFALEDQLHLVTPLICDFVDETWRGRPQGRP